MKKAEYELWKKILNDFIYSIQIIQFKSKLSIPPENAKTVYLKACWVLSQYQKAQILFGIGNKNIDESIEDLKKILPQIKIFESTNQ